MTSCSDRMTTIFPMNRLNPFDRRRGADPKTFRSTSVIPYQTLRLRTSSINNFAQICFDNVYITADFGRRAVCNLPARV